MDRCVTHIVFFLIILLFACVMEIKKISQNRID